MPQNNQSRKFARAALLAAFGIFLIVAGGVATAYAEDEEDDALPDEKFVRSVLRNLGLRNGQEAGIEYKERPPLVLPPSRDLPRPGSAASLAAKTPDWPKDPDEAKRKSEKKAKAERKPFEYFTELPHDRMTPEEWNAGKGNGQTTGTVSGPRTGASQAGGGGNTELSPSELGYTGGLWNDFTSLFDTFKREKPAEYKSFVREPPRASLTDPPAGYRSPAPTQPYGVNTRDNGVAAKGKVDPQMVRGSTN
jgi:hypothetical protein